MLHGPGQSTEDWKVLKEYSAKYASQRPYNEKESRSGGNKKSGTTVNLDGVTEEVNNMEDHDAPIRRKGREKSRHKILRVTRVLQFHHRRNTFMALTA